MNFNLIKLNKVDSTNNYAVKLLKNRIFSPTIIVSNIQTGGRGRYGNKWISLKGNIFMSIFFEINKRLKINEITKKNCRIIKSALCSIIKKKIDIKPPNYLLIYKKKVCGILQEIITSEKRRFLIVGIGLNLIKSPKIDNYPTSHLSKYTKKKIKKNDIYNIIKKKYLKSLRSFN